MTSSISIITESMRRAERHTPVGTADRAPQAESETTVTRVWMTLLGALVGVFLVSCGDPAPLVVGDGCTDGEECTSGATAACIIAWPEGYCTEIDCRLGSCPAGSRCVTGLTFPNVSFDAFCLSTCKANTDCRTGYMCSDVNAPEMVCTPRL